MRKLICWIFGHRFSCIYWQFIEGSKPKMVTHWLCHYCNEDTQILTGPK